MTHLDRVLSIGKIRVVWEESQLVVAVVIVLGHLNLEVVQIFVVL